MLGTKITRIVNESMREVGKQSKVAVWGSNYLMFDKIEDPNCPKCLRGINEIGPTRLNQFTFELSVETAKELTKKEIMNNLVYLPVDLVRGITPKEIQEIRRKHRIPREFRAITDRQGITNPRLIQMKENAPTSSMDMLYGFESEFRRGAQKILEKIVKGKIQIPFGLTTRSDGKEIIETRINGLSGIPLGIENDGCGPRVVFCQLIFTNILRRFEELGFTDLIIYHGEYERICGNQALEVAFRIGLNMKVTMIFFEENEDETFRLTGFDRYPEKLGVR